MKPGSTHATDVHALCSARISDDQQTSRDERRHFSSRSGPQKHHQLWHARQKEETAARSRSPRILYSRATTPLSLSASKMCVSFVQASGQLDTLATVWYGSATSGGNAQCWRSLCCAVAWTSSQTETGHLSTVISTAATVKSVPNPSLQRPIKTWHALIDIDRPAGGGAGTHASVAL